MHAFTILCCFLAALAPALLPPAVSAESATGCHCFKNRTYDPADTFAADDYILATSLNSLIANHYHIAKKEIVFMKMKGGVDPFDLLIGLRAAQVANADFQQLIKQRQQQISWKQILFAPGISNRIRTDTLLHAIQTGADAAIYGQRIADALIADFYGVETAEVERLRATGLSEKELALLFILARTKNIAPAILLAKHAKENESWSGIAHELGIAPDQAGKLILEYARR